MKPETPIQDVVAKVLAAREAFDHAYDEEQSLVRWLAEDLVRQGWTPSEVGPKLRLHHRDGRQLNSHRAVYDLFRQSFGDSDKIARTVHSGVANALREISRKDERARITADTRKVSCRRHEDCDAADDRAQDMGRANADHCVHQADCGLDCFAREIGRPFYGREPI